MVCLGFVTKLIQLNEIVAVIINNSYGLFDGKTRCLCICTNSARNIVMEIFPDIVIDTQDCYTRAIYKYIDIHMLGVHSLYQLVTNL